MKKNKIVFAFAALVLASCGIMPSDSGSNGSSAGSSSTVPVQKEPLFYNQDYAVQTSTAASLLTDSLSFGPQVMGRRNQMTEEEEAAAVEKVHKYLGVMNQILADNPIQSEVLESDRPEYSFKVVVTTTGLDGATSVFTMYVNYEGIDEETSSSSEQTSSEEITSSEEVASSEESSIEESSSEEIVSSSEETTPSSEEQPLNARKLSGDDEEDEEDLEDEEEEREEIDDEYDNEESETEDLDDEDKDEYEDHKDRRLGEENEDGEVATLSGIAIVGDIEYQLMGFSKTEGDEIKTRYFLFLDEQNWVRISSKSEDAGAESKYDIVMKASGEVSRISFKVELEDGETKVSIFIKSESGAPEMYKFKSEVHEETGGQLVRIEAKVDGTKFKAVVLILTDAETGEITYNYRFEGSARDYFEDGHRDYHDDDHEEDDEEDQD